MTTRGYIDCANPLRRGDPLNRGLVSFYTAIPGLSYGRYWPDLVYGAIGQHPTNTANTYGLALGGAKYAPRSYMPGLGCFDLTGATACTAVNYFVWRMSSTSRFSAFAWIYLPSVSGYQGVMSCLDDFGTPGWHFTVIDGQPRFETSVIGISVRTNATLNAGQWYNIGFTFGGGDANSLVLYVNGQKQDVTIIANDAIAEFTSSSGRLGCTYNGAGFLLGYANDFRLYNRVLAADEVAQLFIDTLSGGRRTYRQLHPAWPARDIAVSGLWSQLLLLGAG